MAWLGLDMLRWPGGDLKCLPRVLKWHGHAFQVCCSGVDGIGSALPRVFEVAWKGLEVASKGVEVAWKGLEVPAKGVEVAWKAFGMHSNGLAVAWKGLAVPPKGL